MRTAIATVCLSGTLPRRSTRSPPRGSRASRFSRTTWFVVQRYSRDARRLIEGAGLETVTFQPFRDFEGMPEPLRAEGVGQGRAQVRCDGGARLRSPDGLQQTSPRSVSAVSIAPPPTCASWPSAPLSWHACRFEALSWGRHIHDYRDAWEAVRRADHKALGLVLDSFHILARKTDLSAIKAIPQDRIFLVQMADAPRMDLDYLSWSATTGAFQGRRSADRRLHACVGRDGF